MKKEKSKVWIFAAEYPTIRARPPAQQTSIPIAADPGAG